MAALPPSPGANGQRSERGSRSPRAAGTGASGRATPAGSDEEFVTRSSLDTLLAKAVGSLQSQMGTSLESFAKEITSGVDTRVGRRLESLERTSGDHEKRLAALEE